MSGAEKNTMDFSMDPERGNQTVPLPRYTVVQDNDKRQKNHFYELRSRTERQLFDVRLKHFPKTRGTPYRKSPDAGRKRKVAEEDRDMKHIHNRRSSFRYWDNKYYEDTDFLASQGFYFAGKGQNEVVCYFCEKTIVLRADVDVSKRHSELSPKCYGYFQKP